MFHPMLKCCDKRLLSMVLRFSSNIGSPNKNIALENINKQTFNILDTKQINSDDLDYIDTKNEAKVSVLEPCQDDISYVAPYLKPTFNFAAYVNKSETLQKLVYLGVDLSKLEKIRDVPQIILKLDFERDIQKYVLFLRDLGVETDDIGPFITKNPFIFKEELSNLVVRINYLKSKRFTNEMILRIVQINPQWLNYSTQEIDKSLGYFQKNFLLTGDQIRQLATKSPKLITYNKKTINVNTFVLKEELGYNIEEIRDMILQTPKLLIKHQDFILKTFEYLHKTMQIPIETIAKMPNILMCRVSRLQNRHQFLEKLGKIQFNPKEPNYISPLTIIQGTDSEFATDVAGSSIQAYNAFLKSI